MVSGRRLLSGCAMERWCRLRARGGGCGLGRRCRGRRGVVAAAAGGENQAQECGRDSKAVTGRTCFHGVFLECNHREAKPAGSEVVWRTGSGNRKQQGKTIAVLDRIEPRKGSCAPLASCKSRHWFVSDQLATQPRGQLIQQEHGDEDCHQNCAHMGVLVHVVAAFQFLADAPRAHQADNRGHAHVAIQDV